MKKIRSRQKHRQKMPQRSPALVTKLNRYRHEYYNLAAPGVSVADVTAYASNLLLILRCFNIKKGKNCISAIKKTDILHSGSAALP